MVEKKLAALGVAVPEILLPNEKADLDRWGVVACDQYTAQPEYWERAYAYVGDKPSTLAMILPEAFLGLLCWIRCPHKHTAVPTFSLVGVIVIYFCML